MTKDSGGANSVSRNEVTHPIQDGTVAWTRATEADANVVQEPPHSRHSALIQSKMVLGFWTCATEADTNVVRESPHRHIRDNGMLVECGTASTTHSMGIEGPRRK